MENHEIKYDELEVFSMLDLLESTAQMGRDEIITQEYSEYEKKSKVMDEYIQEFVKLENIMKDYYNLLSKDILAMSEIGEVVKGTDNDLAKLWELENGE